MATIISNYGEGTGGPPAQIAYWERMAKEAPTAEQAQLQLTYELLLQTRTIKQIVFVALILFPAVALIAILVGASA